MAWISSDVGRYREAPRCRYRAFWGEAGRVDVRRYRVTSSEASFHEVGRRRAGSSERCYGRSGAALRHRVDVGVAPASSTRPTRSPAAKRGLPAPPSASTGSPMDTCVASWIKHSLRSNRLTMPESSDDLSHATLTGPPVASTLQRSADPPTPPAGLNREAPSLGPAARLLYSQTATSNCRAPPTRRTLYPARNPIISGSCTLGGTRGRSQAHHASSWEAILPRASATLSCLGE